MKILFANFSPDVSSFDVEHAKAIGRYLSAKGHYVCHGGEFTDWVSFDAVYFSPGVLSMSTVWRYQVLELELSIVENRQQRWATNCDPCLKPMSVLLQLGRRSDASKEYTHVLRLPGQPATPWPANNQFTKYANVGALLDNCQAIVGNWWLYPDVQYLLKYRKSTVVSSSLVYSGWPKADRMQALASLGVSPKLLDTYGDFVQYYGNSAAAVMLSSPEHCGATTLRWSETMVLTVCVSGPAYQMLGWLPSFSVNNVNEARQVMQHVNSLSSEGRQYVLDDQLQQLRNLQSICEDIQYV